MGEESVKAMDEIEVVLKNFGDEQSTLLDKYERLSFEATLTQAILGRSVSEASVGRSQAAQPYKSAPAPPPYRVAKTHPGSGFSRVLKKLINPIFGRKGRGKREVQVSDPKHLPPLMDQSRSMRF